MAALTAAVFLSAVAKGAGIATEAATMALWAVMGRGGV